MVTITRRQLIDLGFVLAQAEHIFKQPITGRFYYAATKNKAIAQEEHKLTQEAYPESPDIVKYDQRRVAIINEVGETIKDGFSKLPVPERDAIINSSALTPEKRDGLVAKIAELDEEFKDVLEEFRKTDAQRGEFLNETIEVDLKTVKPDDVPEIVEDAAKIMNSDGWKIYASLEPMIKE